MSALHSDNFEPMLNPLRATLINTLGSSWFLTTEMDWRTTMSVSAISALFHQFHVPQTYQTKVDDEHAEVLAIKMRDVQTGKDSTVQVGFLKPANQSQKH
jgi:hypothetical protein